MRNTHGIALVAVLLVGLVAIMTMVFSASLVSVGARTASASERQSTQALLAAESGLNTLRARASVTPYSSGSIADWVEDDLSYLDMGNGVSATMAVVAESSNLVTIESTGRVGRYARTVVQEFALVPADPVPLSVSVPGALTSVATIKSKNAALCVTGKTNTVEDWTITQIVSNWPKGNVGDCRDIMDGTTAVDLRDARICDAMAGNYVRVEGKLYQLEAIEPEWPDTCSDDALLRDITSGSTVNIASSSVAEIIPTAISEPLSVSGGSPKSSTVNVTPGTPTLFGLGMPITIGNASDGGPSMGKVTGVVGNRLTIEWEPGREPTGSLGEGTIVRRAISSGVTQNQCDGAGASTFPNGCAPNVDLSDLFKKTFGVSRDDLYTSLSASQKVSASYAMNNELHGLTWVESVSSANSNFKGQRGSGVLIIDASGIDELKLNTDNNFEGLIYVIGNAKINGNSQFRGAVIVEGGADLSDTFAQGNGGIFYDPLELLRALDGITVPPAIPGGLGLPVVGSWRIK